MFFEAMFSNLTSTVSVKAQCPITWSCDSCSLEEDFTVPIATRYRNDHNGGHKDHGTAFLASSNICPKVQYWHQWGQPCWGITLASCMRIEHWYLGSSMMMTSTDSIRPSWLTAMLGLKNRKHRRLGLILCLASATEHNSFWKFSKFPRLFCWSIFRLSMTVS